MLNRTGGKGNETDHNQKVPEERFGVGLLNFASVIAMLRLLAQAHGGIGLLVVLHDLAVRVNCRL
jgi:hypothetical protein